MQANGTTKVQLPILADLLLRADGTWLLKPVVPADAATLDAWVKVRDAARILRVSTRDVYRWLGVYLVYRRPTRSRVEISLKSVRALQVATNDVEFWDDERRQQGIERAVSQAMGALAESSLQGV
jgi:hypothetical protein